MSTQSISESSVSRWGRANVQGLHGKTYTPEKKSSIEAGVFKTCKTALNESSERVARLVIKPGRLAKREDAEPLETIYQTVSEYVERSDRILEALSDAPGIVRRYGSIELAEKSGDPKFWLFEEFFPGKDLTTFLQNNRLFPEERQDLAIQLLTAVAGMHARGVIHGDLKPENIVIKFKNGTIRLGICDFDTSWMEGESLTTLGATYQFLSPERARSYIPEDHSKWRSKETWTKETMRQNDLWATGAILHIIYYNEQHPLIEDCLTFQKYASRRMDADDALLCFLAGTEDSWDRLHCSSKDPEKLLIHRLMSPNPPGAQEALEEFQKMLENQPSKAPTPLIKC